MGLKAKEGWRCVALTSPYREIDTLPLRRSLLRTAVDDNDEFTVVAVVEFTKVTLGSIEASTSARRSTSRKICHNDRV